MPTLGGREQVVRTRMEEMGVAIPAEIINPDLSPRIDAYATALYEVRQRKGITLREARALLRQPNYFASMMLRAGDTDAFVAGLTYHYPHVISPALQVIGPAPGVSRVAGLYVVIHAGHVYLLDDPTGNV